ncbi:cadherin-related family member 2 isoform X1 [Lepisosteus oculatus]|uniref:cadherin-related family member 2 isoform X1 n=1 Tax=Lepisosteus oculatus TaxID=7918 RepID=UPI0035F5034B
MMSLVLLTLPCFFASVSGNLLPTFCSNMSVIILREDLRIGEYAFTICATDVDSTDLTYSIIGDNSYYFEVNQKTGDVKVKSSLDREDKETFGIDITVSDGYNDEPAKKHASIILLDANDNRPIFIGAPYNVKVPENTALGTILFKVTATDEDSGLAGVVSYSIDEVVPDDSSLFKINRSGEVLLNGFLNYANKSTFYQLTINASDGGGELYGQAVVQSTSAFAFITIEDVADLDPDFLNLPYQTSVKEHTPVGTSVFKVQAVDGDRGIKDKIFYSIKETNAPGLFDIDRNNGVITVKGEIDREALLNITATVNLQVMAEEENPNIHGQNAMTSAEVIIKILDINDNKPKFYNCMESECDFSDSSVANSFTGDIQEHASGGVPVANMTITVRDQDEGNNAKFNLRLEGEDKDAFSVSPTTAMSSAQVQILVKSPSEVNYESKTMMRVEIVASDVANETYYCSTATVTIALIDMNDNRPEFKQETYQLQVNENSPNGKALMTITASDPDTADEGKITYRLLPDSILPYFEVGKESGTIFVKNSTLLDRETRPIYFATLQAIDTANNTGTAVLEITLIDENDETPEMARDYYIDFVEEGKDGHLQLQIQAFDKDEPGTNNSEIRYRIEPSEFSDNFTINEKTGMLENNGPLDREAIDPSLNGAIKLIVTAYDLGFPSMSSSVNVTINVEDINDNKPVFAPDTYDFSVNETEKGAFVGLVFAQDADQTEIHNRISFSITDGSFGNFIIRTFYDKDLKRYRGNITVDPDVELNFEAVKNYTLTVEATDLGLQEDRARVKVKVLDVNDKPPTFEDGSLKDLGVKENTTGLGVVRNITGTDEDTKHSLVYHLLSVKCLCNLNVSADDCEKDWFRLELSGSLLVNNDFVIDYEQCHEVQMEIQVVDILTEKGVNHSSPGILKIHIIDINDNAPQFISSETLFVVVPEVAAKDSEVGRVTAKDRDSGENKVIVFDVLTVEFIHSNGDKETMSNLFYADTVKEIEDYAGIIRTSNTLNTNLKGRYLVTVGAKDKGVPSLNTSIQLDVYTVDSSFRVQLEFRSSIQEIDANIDTIKGVMVSATKATVHIVKIESKEQAQRASEFTVLVAYFVYPNGSAIIPSNIITILQEDRTAVDVLYRYGLQYIESGEKESKEIDPVYYAVAGLAAGFVILLVIMITTLVCTQRSYKRKLKAANAVKSAAFMGADNRHTGQVVPGTNKYTMEGANPVLNLNIDSATDLGFDEEGSNIDRVSLDSLDENLDINMSEKENMHMMMIQEEDEENPNEPHYIEPLGAALAQHRKKDNGETHTFTNPSLDTTDL